MTYTLTMRDDVDGSVCVVPADGVMPGPGILIVPPETAVDIVDEVSRRGGTWTAHPTLQAGGRPVAVAGCDVTAAVIAESQGITPLDPTAGTRGPSTDRAFTTAA